MPTIPHKSQIVALPAAYPDVLIARHLINLEKWNSFSTVMVK